MSYIQRLTPKMIADIIKLMKQDELPNAPLAKRFSVSKGTIADIRRKYVPESVGDVKFRGLGRAL